MLDYVLSIMRKRHHFRFQQQKVFINALDAAKQATL